MVAAISHEMRSPLNSIINMSEELESHLDNEGLELLDSARNSAKHLLYIVNDIYWTCTKCASASLS